LRTIGELRRLPVELLHDRFGKAGEHLWQLAHGIDQRRVVPDREAKSISHVNMEQAKRRVRIYHVRTGASDEDRRTLQRAATRLLGNASLLKARIVAFSRGKAPAACLLFALRSGVSGCHDPLDQRA